MGYLQCVDVVFSQSLGGCRSACSFRFQICQQTVSASRVDAIAGCWQAKHGKGAVWLRNPAVGQGRAPGLH